MMGRWAMAAAVAGLALAGCGTGQAHNHGETEIAAGATSTLPAPSEPDEPTLPPAPPIAGVERSESSAVAFARDLSSFTQFLVYAEANHALAVTEAHTTPAGYDRVRQQILDEIGPLRTALGDLPPGELWFTTAPLSHEVISYTDTTATIEVWSVTVVARAHLMEPTANYATTTYRLVWSQDRWLLDSFDDELGPSPASDFTAERAELSDLTKGLEGHRITLPALFGDTQ